MPDIDLLAEIVKNNQPLQRTESQTPEQLTREFAWYRDISPRQDTNSQNSQNSEWLSARNNNISANGNSHLLSIYRFSNAQQSTSETPNEINQQ